MQKHFESVEDFYKNGSAGDLYIAFDSNPKRLEDEELWVDVYIKPVKPIDHITIPLDADPNDIISISYDFESSTVEYFGFDYDEPSFSEQLSDISTINKEPIQKELDFTNQASVEPKKFIKINLLKKFKKKIKVNYKELGDIIDSQLLKNII